MVKLNTYKVDLDYEAFLFDSTYIEDAPVNQKIIREFEYVFFIINKEKAILKNYKTYGEDYLEHLKKMGFVIPQFDSGSKCFSYWWGNRHNKEIERELNSKITSSNLASLNQWGFKEGAIVETLEELKRHLKNYPQKEKWVIKHPNGFSGIGHKQFNSNAFNDLEFSKLLREKFLLEPEYERVFDIGTTFEVENGVIKKYFMVENINSKVGRFRGGVGASSVDKFKKYIFNKYDYSLNELEEMTQKIAQIYLKKGASSNIQIDSFIYREDEELKIYALVEVNYRKTMGLVIQSLAEKYSEADWVEWRIESVKKLRKNQFGPEWIKISPEGNHFHSFVAKHFFKN